MTRVIIIGGGISGLSAAAALAADAHVTVLEQEDVLGYHASGRSAAMFLEGYGNAVVRALNAQAAQVHHGLGVLSPRGVLLVAAAAAETLFEKDAIDMAAQPLLVAQACKRVPILNPATVTKAAALHNALDIDTDALLQHYARKARAEGVSVLTKAGVTGMDRGSNGWTVRTASREFEADVIVNAAGAWADQIAVLAGVPPSGLIPHRRSVARVPAPEGHDVRAWPMLLGAGEQWYAKPDAGAWIISPADEDPTDPHDAFASDMVLAEGIARYEEHVIAPVTRVTSNWAGLRTFAPDRTPVIGPDPAEPSFFWLAGQGGYGFQIGPAAAELAHALIIGTTPVLDAKTVAALRPGRPALRQTNSGR